jgi:Flp pilus assembly pilin Flp
VFAIGQTNRRKLEMKAGLRRFVLDDEGAALLEYGMIVLLIAVLCIVTLRTIGSKVSNGFSSANSMIP